jgi:hypothetical protein
MQTVLEQHFTNLLETTIYGFIVLKDIRDVRTENVKDADMPYQPSCKIIEMEANDGSFYKPNNQEKYNSFFMIPAFSEMEIGLTNETNIIDICKGWNETEYNRAIQELSEWKSKTDSTHARKRIKYFSDVIGEFDVWYYEMKINHPIPISTKGKLGSGIKSSRRKSNVKDYDKEVEQLIKFYLHFYRDHVTSENINHYDYAQQLDMSSPTFTRRFKDDEFLRRIVERIKKITDSNVGWNLQESEKDILINLFNEITAKRKF